MCIDEKNKIYVDMFKFGQSSREVRSYCGMNKHHPGKLQFKITIDDPKEFETYMLDKLKNEGPWNELLIFPPEVGNEYFYLKDNNRSFVEMIEPYIKDEIIKFKELHKGDADVEEEEEEVTPLWGYNEYVLHVLRDGVKRTATDIYQAISDMPKHPWGPEARTPWATCSSKCGKLAIDGKIQRTDDRPCMYYTDNNID